MWAGEECGPSGVFKSWRSHLETPVRPRNGRSVVAGGCSIETLSDMVRVLKASDVRGSVRQRECARRLSSPTHERAAGVSNSPRRPAAGLRLESTLLAIARCAPNSVSPPPGIGVRPLQCYPFGGISADFRPKRLWGGLLLSPAVACAAMTFFLALSQSSERVNASEKTEI